MHYKRSPIKYIWLIVFQHIDQLILFYLILLYEYPLKRGFAYSFFPIQLPIMALKN